ncbi:MAG: hypothetical protein Q7K29_03095 [Thermoleophilia bacterium]|nr:hypothetical protein [Thermoleophilia bacterium]
METLGGLLLVLVILMAFLAPAVLIVLLFIFILKRNRKTTDEMLIAASQLKAVYTTSPQQSLLDPLRQFRFTKHDGRGGRINQLFDLKRNNVPWKVFDYSYETSGAGVGNDSDFTHTFLVAQSQPSFNLLPAFVLVKDQPNFLEKLLGNEGGIVVDDPEFEKTYTLDGPDQKRVHDLFSSPEIIAFFDAPSMVNEMKNLMVECDTRNFVLFRTGGWMKPLERIRFLNQAETILSLLVKQAQKQKGS